MNHFVHGIELALRDEFHTLAFAKDAFPMLIDWGVEDYSVAIHSLGCNYLSAFGRKLGFWAISDYPVRLGLDRGTPSVRPDAVWWSRPNASIVLLGEFERFDLMQTGKLKEKAKNLLRVHRQLREEPRALLLLTWAFSGTDLRGLDEVRAVGHDGFRTADGVSIPGIGSESVFLVATAIFSGNDRCRLQGVRV